ncbi:MAG: ABC transporter permease [Actinobacteria bacterium]|nr:ABC transporter permease [Actinomycetota bacterium]
MTTADPQAIGAVPPSNSLGAIVRRRLEALKAGDVGTLPIILGLVAIVAFFYWKNENYLSAGNFTNLMTQMAGVTTIAIGVVFVLLLGEIDLSISYVSGVAGVIAAQLQIPDESWQVKGVLAIAIAVTVTALIGGVQGGFVAFVGIPSFVVTLAGLLFWQGVILYVIGGAGVIVIEDSTINNVANYFFSDTAGYLIAAGASALFAASTLAGLISRRRHGIQTDNLVVVAAKLALFVVVIFGAVLWANRERGFPLAFLLVIVFLVFWTWVAERTTFGRHVYAVGGNAEAARRAGINVPRVRVIVFMISGLMAGLGGVIFAARLNSVDLNAGGGTLLLDAISAAVIGGTSLFGGRGRVISALMGALVISTVANGIDLLGYSSAIKYMVTGLILLAAVTLDALSRRRLERSGR